MLPAGRFLRQVTRMGNKSGKGPFTPVVIVVRNVMGKKEFNQFRGKAISLHSQGALPTCVCALVLNSASEQSGAWGWARANNKGISAYHFKRCNYKAGCLFK